MSFYKIQWYINNIYKYKIYTDKNKLIKAILNSFGGIAGAINLVINNGVIFLDYYQNYKIIKRKFLKLKYILSVNNIEYNSLNNNIYYKNNETENKIIINIKKDNCKIELNKTIHNKIIYDEYKSYNINLLYDLLLLSYKNGIVKLKTKINDLKKNDVDNKIELINKINKNNINKKVLFYDILIQPYY
jgi:hypothetical protein